MANGDDLDYAFGQFGDPNPPGTMTPLGLQPDDPLHDWGSNMKPSDLAQYVHDPQGFMNNMANSGKPPPEHNYVQSPGGQLQAVDQSGAPIRTTAQGRVQGNISDYLSPTTGQTAAQAVAAPVAPGGQSRALGFTDIPPQPGEEGTNPIVKKIQENLQRSGQAQPYPPGQQPGTPPLARPAPAPTAPAPSAPAAPRSKFDWSPGGGGEGGGALNPPDYIPEPKPLPPLRNPNPVPKDTTPLPRPSPLRQTPADISEEAGGTPAPVASTPEKKAKDEVKPFSSEAVSDFAKSLQGVKMPTRPAWQPMGAPAVRSPVGIHPEIQTLLSAIGQSRPSPQQVALMKLLGRA